MRKQQWLSLIAACILGCATSTGVSQLDPTAQGLGAVSGTSARGSTNRNLTILEVRGPSCEVEPCKRNTDYLRLSPGRYVFTVKVSKSLSSDTAPTFIPIVDAVQLGIDIAALAKTQVPSTPREISFDVKAGRSYTIHYDSEASAYAIYVRDGVRKRTNYRASIDAPPSAARCLPDVDPTLEFACLLVR